MPRAPHPGQMMKEIIRRTGDPFAPIILQDAYAAVDRLGKFLGNSSDKEKVAKITEQLMAALAVPGLTPWQDDRELNILCRSSEFSMALCGMLCSAIQEHTLSLAGDPTRQRGG